MVGGGVCSAARMTQKLVRGVPRGGIRSIQRTTNANVTRVTCELAGDGYADKNRQK